MSPSVIASGKMSMRCSQICRCRMPGMASRWVSAMRNAHPPALRQVLNRDPQYETAVSEIVLQADNF